MNEFDKYQNRTELFIYCLLVYQTNPQWSKCTKIKISKTQNTLQS